MTDEQMDARLHAAGERWRGAEQTATAVAAPTPTIDPQPARPTTGHRRTGLIASAALVAAALVVGLTLVIRSVGGGGTSQQTAAGLVGTVWRFTDSGAKGGPASYATLALGTDGTLVVDDECAVLGARATVRNNRLVLSAPDVRYRQCTDQTSPILIPRNLPLLVSGPSVRVIGSKLVLGGRLHFVAAPGVPAPTLDVPTFQGAQWQATQVRDAAGRRLAASGGPTLSVDRGRLQATDGCNGLSGTASTPDGRDYTVGQLATTAIGCPAAPSIGVLDAVLAGPFHVEVDGTTAVVSKPGAGTVTYRWVPADGTATDSATLTGTTWHLTRVALQPPAAAATLQVGTDGRVTGNDGCQDLAGTATVGSGTWSTRGLPTTPPASCPRAARDQASTIDSYLKGGLWSARDGQLVLDGGGAQGYALVWSSTTAPTYAALTGRTWRLSQYTKESQGASSGASVSGIVDLAFSDGSATLTVRCGSYTAPVRVSAGNLSLGRLTFRTHSCPMPSPDLRTEEQTVASLIGQVFHTRATWVLRDGRLDVARDGITLGFVAAKGR